MKSFFQFLNEATQSQASMQAKKLNLKSDGHGYWLDSRGNKVATTEKGKLVFLDKQKKSSQEEPDAKTCSSKINISRKICSKTKSRTCTKSTSKSSSNRWC
jgi:hypothetical protein